MAWPPEQHLQTILTQAQRVLGEIQIIRLDTNEKRALIDFEATWREYRLIVSEIHRFDTTVRYSYSILTSGNQLIHRFDNSRDNLAIQLRYGQDWKRYLQAEVPHQHDARGNISLTNTPITFEGFVTWLETNLP